MGADFIYPEFEVVRNESRCTACRVCERQCANEVHSYSEARGMMMSDESRCVNCQRCVSFCPERALKIVKTDCALRENANWSSDTIREIYKQASSGGVLLSSMGNPKSFPVYWDKMLINASQVTNPPIDPLREPMETHVFLGKKPEKVMRLRWAMALAQRRIFDSSDWRTCWATFSTCHSAKSASTMESSSSMSLSFCFILEIFFGECRGVPWSAGSARQ